MLAAQFNTFSVW